MADLNEEIQYTEVSYAMIGNKKYKLYIGNDGKWYKKLLCTGFHFLFLP